MPYHVKLSLLGPVPSIQKNDGEKILSQLLQKSTPRSLMGARIVLETRLRYNGQSMARLSNHDIASPVEQIEGTRTLNEPNYWLNVSWSWLGQK